MGVLATQLSEGDALVMNDAFTLPAAFPARAGLESFELRLLEAPDAHGQARALLLGAGSMRQRTEDRGAAPVLAAGTRVHLASSLHATVLEHVGHPRLVRLAFAERGAKLWSRLLTAGSPIQYAYIEQPLALYDVQTAYAGVPFAAELPSAGYGLTWSVLGALRKRGVQLARVTHAAGISSTGDAELDAQLPLTERTIVSEETRRVLAGAKRVVAVGTSVVRALESEPGARETSLRIDPAHPLRVVDGLLTGLHAPGESHFDLLGAFASRAALDGILAAASHLSSHEFGDALLLL